MCIFLVLDRMDAYRKAEAHLMNPVQVALVYLEGKCISWKRYPCENIPYQERSYSGTHPTSNICSALGKAGLKSALV